MDKQELIFAQMQSKSKILSKEKHQLATLAHLF